MKVKEKMLQMTLEEKAKMCQGASTWETLGIPRLNIDSLWMADGPHGLRKQEGKSDHLGMHESVKATCFPAACLTACSWDEDLLFSLGQALGDECLSQGVNILLGPGVNIKRSPLCGRNFEYFSEDPLLTGKLASAYITGVQSKGVGTSLKHFAMNNAEYCRMTANSMVDDRAKREIYLKPFEICVKQSKPWTVMTSYNRVDGVYASENKELLKDILRNDWGFNGLVMTDWGGVNDRVEGIRAGCDLEMPPISDKSTEQIIKALKRKQLKEADLNQAIENIIRLSEKARNLDDYSIDLDKHHDLASKIVGESAVLLKNDGVLPLSNQSFGLFGSFAETPRFQGAGSSLVNPHRLESLKEVMEESAAFKGYQPGYERYSDQVNPSLMKEALALAKEVDVAIVVVGLTENYESEGYDRTCLNLPDNHQRLIEELAKVTKLVVVLQNGSVVEMPWIDKVSAVLESYLPGQAGGKAIFDILTGKINPSGKLAESFPFDISDTPSYRYYPGNPTQSQYRESIYVGYRYYDTAKVKPLFAFGHGLSYTSFSYEKLEIIALDQDQFQVKCKVKNTGEVFGKEVVQLYVHANDSKVFKAEKSLKDFKKISLAPGQTKEVCFHLDKMSFAFYDTTSKDWCVDDGFYQISLGGASDDLRQTEDVRIIADQVYDHFDEEENLPCYYDLSKKPLTISEDSFTYLYGRPIKEVSKSHKPYHLGSSLGDLAHTKYGRTILQAVEGKKHDFAITTEEAKRMERPSSARQAPIKVVPMFAKMKGQSLPKYFSEGVVAYANKEYIKALYYMLKK